MMNASAPQDSPSRSPEEASTQGVVTRILPGELFEVRLSEGRVVTASLSLEVKRVVIKLRPGDPVGVKHSPYNSKRGCIIFI